MKVSVCDECGFTDLQHSRTECPICESGTMAEREVV